ncbi:hypothetical protein D3C84_742380 [compost metagenome]
MQPVLQFLIVVEFGELAFDQLALTGVDVPISLGRRYQRLENRLTVLFDLRRRQAIQGLRLGLRCRALLGLPIAIGLVGDHAQCRETAIHRHLAADLARLFVAQQQAHGPGGQGTTAGTGKQAAEAARATATAEQPAQSTTGRLFLRPARLVLQHVLAGLEELVEQSTGVHFLPPLKGLTEP